MKSKEHFLPIPGTDGKYLLSNYGRVQRSGSTRLLRPQVKKSGVTADGKEQLMVQSELSLPQARKWISIARMVRTPEKQDPRLKKQ